MMSIGIGISSSRRSVGGTWTPSSVSGLRLWLDMDNIVGDPITAIADSSAQGNNATGVNAPVVGTINGVNCAEGDGISDQSLDLDAEDSLTAFTIGLVGSFDATADSILGSKTTGSPRFQLGGLSIFRVRFDDATQIEFDPGLVATTEEHVYIVTYDGTTVTGYVDGVEKAGGVAEGKTFTIGRILHWQGTTTELDGRVGDVVVYNTTLSSGDRGELNTYLGAAYGLF